jgi:hypothetical protein
LPHIRLVSSLTILDKLGYIPIPSKAECIFSDSVKKSFESLFGKDATPIILNNLSSLYGLSEKELTTIMIYLQNHSTSYQAMEQR